MGQAEPVGVAHDEGIGPGHVQAGFDDGGAQQHVVLALVEVQHHVLQGVLPHLTVAHGDAGLGHQFFQPGEHHLDGLHPVVQHVHLAAPGQLPQDGVPHQAVGILHHVGLHRVALLRRGAQKAHVPDAHHGHVQGAGDGGGRQGEHVDIALHLLDGFLVLDAEALLLVHHQQAQVLVLHVLAQQAMGSDDDVHLAPFQPGQGLLLFRRGTEAADGIHPHGKAVEPAEHGGVVLLHQDGGGGQQRRLLAVHHRLEDGPEGHLGFAVAHVAAQQPVHHPGRFHVPLDVCHRLHLVRGFLVLEGVLELALPGSIRGKGVSGGSGTGGIQLNQLSGDVLNSLLHLGLLPLPFAPGQPVELGGLPLGADVLLHPVQLVGGHIQLVAALVLDVEKIPEGALAGQAHGAHVPADAVAFVDHVVPHVQVGKGGNLLP